jgi:predicted phosphodiesterase
MTLKPTIGRRSFLKLGSAVFALSSAAGRRAPAQSSPEGSTVYTGRFAPDGADCRLAFVCDHHYWPDHLENWGGGNQITSNCERRMPDLIQVLNEEHPDLSIHAGDVISAGGSFFPPPEEYAKQLAFAKRFYSGLAHPFIPLIGNHETLEAQYISESQFEPWSRHFGAPYRHHELKGWRVVGLNCLIPNPNARQGKGDSYGNVYGIDDKQLEWLRGTLRDAAARGQKAVVCAHVPPNQWLNAADFERIITSSGCVKAILCGHAHRNALFFMGGIPVLVRVGNVSSPFGYSMVHLYPDGRIVVVQKSQHFPLDDFISQGMQAGAQGSEADRYLTLGGSSRLPLEGLRVLGNDAQAVIVDGHLRLTSRSDRALVLVDAAALRSARLTLTAVKAGGERMGAVALAGSNGEGGIEATVTSRYSPDGKVYLARDRAGMREVLARSWFNISDNIAYRLTLEVRNGRIAASWKNMLELKAPVEPGASGYFGFWIERGTMFVTDLKLDS